MKLGNQPLARFVVEPFGIALLAHGERCIDENFEKFTVTEQFSGKAAVGPGRAK